MREQGVLRIQGQVEEALPATRFRVRLEDGTEVLAHLAGKMRMYRIRVLPGDRVLLEMSAYDRTKGRIIRRF